ncbi:E3 ubiquitin-protein ligase [Canna indica]|uniref:E3 ubiquitin-protein ligase n=1 Tax=Canna indica TaxID=4628 RepID=A0AAQ3QHS1_9LILI|nr:E3 ubiquitin-protein ligase [Canna indica]
MATSGTKEAAMAAGSTQVVKVKRELLAACMTCPIYNKLLRDATTISECLHTFCRKCIFEKLNEKDADCCPVCNIPLCCLPVEKLKADHNLQDLRAKIFPLKK